MDNLRLESERHATPPLTGALAAAQRDFGALTLPADRRLALGIFLRHLARGERVARFAAMRQAALAPDRVSARFLRSQARQESLHAALFDTVAGWFQAPRLALRDDPYAAYESRLGHSGYVESVVATQGVLEALGEAMLGRLETGLVRRGAGFARLRQMLLRQEATHHAFGLQRFAAWREDATLDRAGWARLAAPYFKLADRMIAAGEPALRHFNIAPKVLQLELRERCHP